MITSLLLTRRGIAKCLAVLALMLGASSAFGADGTKKLRLAYAGWEIGTAVAYIGVDAGLFKQQGIDIEELPIRDTLSAGVQSLLGVDVLIGFGNPLGLLQPLAGGADITVIGAHVSFDQYGMGVGSAISELKQLKGKKVGVAALGSRSDLAARVLLRRAGLDPANDVEMVAAGLSPSRAMALVERSYSRRAAKSGRCATSAEAGHQGSGNEIRAPRHRSADDHAFVRQT